MVATILTTFYDSGIACVPGLHQRRIRFEIFIAAHDGGCNLKQVLTQWISTCNLLQVSSPEPQQATLSYDLEGRHQGDLVATAR